MVGGDTGAELLDVVDGTDCVIAQRSRREVHLEGLRHRSAHVLVFNPDGEIFLQRRAWTKECNPGCWDSSVAGHVDAGESYDECSVRETGEEIGLFEIRPERLFKLEACPETGMEFSWVYRLVSGQPLALNYDEMVEGAWFTPEEVDLWVRGTESDVASTLRLIWPKYRALYPG